MPASVPIVDLAPWFSTDETARANVAAQVDAALRSVGFFLIAGHGVPADHAGPGPGRGPGVLRAACRSQAAVRGHRGRAGLAAHRRRGERVRRGHRDAAGPKESFAVGADQPTGDPVADGYWFQPNIYPAEVPGLRPAVVGYLARMRALADELLVICAVALGLESTSSPGTPVTPRTP